MARRPRTGRYTPPTRARVAIVSTGLGLLAVAQATPAQAAGSAAPGITWAGSDAGGTSGDGRLTGTVRLGARVVTDDPVDGWALSVLDGAGAATAFGTICHDEFSRPKNDFSLDCRWDTTRYPGQGPAANRPYRLRLSVAQGSELRPAGDDRPVGLANPAAAPADVTVAYDEAARRVTLAWAPNPEPDIAHYRVEEKIDRGQWTAIGDPAETRFERTVSGPGEHTFRLAAVRRGPDGGTVGPGPWARPKGDGRVKVREDRPSGRPAEPGNAGRSGSGGADGSNRREPHSGGNPSSGRDTATRSDDRRAGRNSTPPSNDPDRRKSSTTPADDRRARRNSTPPSNDPDRRKSSTTPADDRRARRDSTPPSNERSAARPAPAAASSDARGRARDGAAGPGPSDGGGATNPASADVPPADHAFTFSSSSADPFAKLSKPAPKAAVSRPATARPALSEPDADFAPALPYSAVAGADAVAGGEDRAADIDLAEGAAEAGSTPEAELAGPASEPSRPRQNHRPQAAGMLVVAAGLLVTAIRPIPRRRARRGRASFGGHPAIPPAGPVVADPEAAAPATTQPADPQARIAELEERIARLEEQLGPASSPGR